MAYENTHITGWYNHNPTYIYMATLRSPAKCYIFLVGPTFVKSYYINSKELFGNKAITEQMCINQPG